MQAESTMVDCHKINSFNISELGKVLIKPDKNKQNKIEILLNNLKFNASKGLDLQIEKKIARKLE